MGSHKLPAWLLQMNEWIVTVILTSTVIDFMCLVMRMLALKLHIEAEVTHGIAAAPCVAGVGIGTVYNA